MTNINTELFKRYAPAKKLDIIASLTDEEVRKVTLETLTRVVKEAGVNRYKSRDKQLRLSRECRTGNDWNSDVEGLETYKGKLFLDIYVQYDSTDTNVDAPVTEFLRNGDYRAEVKAEDRYGNPRTYYATYDAEDKANVLRAILRQYVLTKYADKI